MNWKGLKGLVLLLSITLAFPSSAVHVAAAAQRSSQKQRADSSQKFSSKGHSSLTTFPSSELYESGTKRDRETADSKEAPLIRLKRIKRQTETASSSAQRSTSSSSNWPGTPMNPEPEVLKFHDKSSSPIGARPTNAVSDRRRFSASHSSAHRDSTGSRVHTKMLRKKESANRNGNRGGGKGHATGKVPTTRKSNEISDPVQTAAAAAIGHHHKSSAPGTGGGGGGYFHHRNEQSRLESAAEFALRQRTPHKKTKRLKNRSELDLLKAGGRTGHVPPPPPPPQLSRPRPAETVFGGGQANRYHDAMVKARGRGHAAPVKAGHGDDHGGGEASHRSRRGQRSGATAVNGSGGGGGGHGGQKVRAELEHIKRMQRDLMKEISHLEHMKKKKKVQRRSASSSSSSSLSSIHQQNHRQQIAKAHRK